MKEGFLHNVLPDKEFIFRTVVVGRYVPERCALNKILAKLDSTKPNPCGSDKSRIALCHYGK